MSHKHYTKDESYVLALYELAEQKGDVASPIDRYEAGARAGIQERGVNAICKLLVQANFIKKSSETEVYLTPHGEKLAKRLRLE